MKSMTNGSDVLDGLTDMQDVNLWLADLVNRHGLSIDALHVALISMKIHSPIVGPIYNDATKRGLVAQVLRNSRSLAPVHFNVPVMNSFSVSGTVKLGDDDDAKPKQWKPPMPGECDCGGVKARTTHSHWCATMEKK
jgi:hypothetical protein